MHVPMSPLASSVQHAPERGERLLADVLVAAGIDPIPLGPAETQSHTPVIDGAELPATTTVTRSGRTGPASGGVEVRVTCETSWWNPQEVARCALSVSVIDRRGVVRSLFLRSEAPFDVAWVNTSGAALVPDGWVEAWFAAERVQGGGPQR